MSFSYLIPKKIGKPSVLTKKLIMKLHVKSLYQGKVLLNFTIKVHKRAKSELHLDEAFYAYGGGVPDYNYELEIIESSISDEEIKDKKLHIYFLNNEKYVCYPVQQKTLQEAESVLEQWGFCMGFHIMSGQDPNEIAAKYQEKPLEQAALEIKNLGFLVEILRENEHA